MAAVSRLLNKREAAERLGISVLTLDGWILDRKLAYVKFGTSRRAAVRIEEAELERFIGEHRRAALEAAPRAVTPRVAGPRAFPRPVRVRPVRVG